MAGSHRLAAAAALAVAALLAGCGGKPSEPREDPRNSGGGAAGNYENSRITDLLDLDEGAGGAGGLTPVNRYLWRASLDTLSYLPLASTDPFTGVIATDWAASPDAPNERFKVTAYVKSPELAARALQVAVYREVRDPAGAWVTAPVSGETARKLEDAILLRARQIKLGEREAS